MPEMGVHFESGWLLDMISLAPRILVELLSVVPFESAPWLVVGLLALWVLVLKERVSRLEAEREADRDLLLGLTSLFAKLDPKGVNEMLLEHLKKRL